MRYDLLCLPGVTPAGCGSAYVSRELAGGHERGDIISIACSRCGRVRKHEVRGRLEGLA